MASIWGISPKQSIEGECERRGRPAFVRGCVDLLSGREVDDELIVALGGPHARLVLDGHEGGRGGYWPRVWAVRGLLYAWDDSAATALSQRGLDPSWRVREMMAKVIARNRVDQLLDTVLALREDPVPRVRVAAERAIRDLTQNGP